MICIFFNNYFFAKNNLFVKLVVLFLGLCVYVLFKYD